MHTRSTVQCEYMYIVKLIQYTDVSKQYTICLTKGPRKNENITKELLIVTQHICVLLFASVDNTMYMLYSIQDSAKQHPAINQSDCLVALLYV